MEINLIRQKVKSVASSVSHKCSCHINFNKTLQALNLAGKNYGVFAYKIHAIFNIVPNSALKTWNNLEEVVEYVKNRVN